MPLTPAEQASAIAKFEKTLYKPAANEANGYFKPRYPPPPPLVAPKEVTDNGVLREFRFKEGFNTARPLKNNPNIDPSLVPGQKFSTGGSGGSPPPSPRTPNFLERGLNRLVGEGPGVQLGNRNPISAPPLRAPLASGIARNLRGIANPRSIGLSLIAGSGAQKLNEYSAQSEISDAMLFRSLGAPSSVATALAKYLNTVQKFQGNGEFTLQHQLVNPTIFQKAIDIAGDLTGFRKTIKDSGIPDWLNPFKPMNPEPSPNGTPNGNPDDGTPNRESKAWFPSTTRIVVWSTNNRRYVELDVLSYSITEQPKFNQGTAEHPVMSARNSNFTYLREGTDDYFIRWKFFESLNPIKISEGNFNCEPWTFKNLGRVPGGQPNPEDPENIVPETGAPFFPPLPDYLDDLARPYPPTILDPDDFRPGGVDRSPPPILVPSIPTLDPSPFDPLKEERKERDANPVAPIFPSFNPTNTPSLPTPPTFEPTPPTFEPTPPNPNQRLNDRGIFPSVKAPITSTVSGSPLSPDKEIGGDPVRLKPITPIKQKPITEDPIEQKKKEEEKTFPFLPIPPIFPKPTDSKGTIDPTTADDITKSRNPPPPPTGTKPKCQNGCMAGLETGQQAILDKLGQGVNAASNLANLALLPVINNKLGDQLTGGLSGKLTRFTKWMQFDRIMNIFILIGVLHNAAMLSRSAAETIGELTSQALTVIGIKGDDNQPIDVNEIIGKQANAFMASILGETVWNGTKESWQKANRIISTASNIISTVRSIADSTRDVME